MSVAHQGSGVYVTPTTDLDHDGGIDRDEDENSRDQPELEFHPMACEYPTYSDEKLWELAESIRTKGLKVPIIVWRRQPSDRPVIIDGRNRYLACKLVGIPYRVEEWFGPESEIRSHVIALNEERRDLSPEWRQARRAERIERVVARRKAGESLPLIARAEGISVAQVQRDLEKAESTLPPGKVDSEQNYVTGIDGRTRDVSNIGKKATPQPTDEEIEHHDHEQHEAGVRTLKAVAEGRIPAEVTVCLDGDDEVEAPTDEAGIVLPEQARAAFALLPELRKLRDAVIANVKELERLGESPLGAQLHIMSIKNHMVSAKDAVWAARPAHVCPYCKGQASKCRACKGQGWVTKSSYNAAPKDGAL